MLLASSILSTKEVLRTLPVQRLKRDTLFVDVLSVKVRASPRLACRHTSRVGTPRF